MRTFRRIQRPTITRMAMPSAVALLGSAVSVIGLAAPAYAGGLATLQVRDGHGVTVVEADEASRVVLRERGAITSFDGRFVAATTTGAGRTTDIRVLDGITGAAVWKVAVAGSWRPEAVSADGNRVIAGDPAISATPEAVPNGRSSTPFLLLGRGEAPRALTLPGNFVAEAFSSASSTIVLVEHLPADRPTAYRVRPLDVAAGRLSASTGVVKPGPASGRLRVPTTIAPALELDVMRGIRLRQALGTGAKALYTLYDASTPAAPGSVFVHALDLVGVRATCLGVPEQIEAGKGTGAIAVVDDHTLVVVGSKGVVKMNAATGDIEKTALRRRLGMIHVAAHGGSLWVSSGRVLERVDLVTLEPRGTWRFSRPIASLAALPYATLATVVDTDGTIWLAGTGATPIRRGTLAAPVGVGAELRFPSWAGR